MVVDGSFFGLRIASPAYLASSGSVSVCFVAARKKRFQIHLDNEFKTRCPKGVALLENLAVLSESWEILAEVPAVVHNNRFLISLRDTATGHVSFHTFVGRCTFINVAACTDGVQRRGVVAKR